MTDVGSPAQAIAAQRWPFLIFDWDGTLSDSAQLIVDTMQQAITGLGLAARNDDQIRELIGLGLADGMRRLYPEMDTPTLLQLLEQYRKHWLSSGGQGPAEAPLFDGALAALETLHRQGHRLAIATGKSRVGLNRSLKVHRAVQALMSATRTADETANKPNPLMLRELIAEAELLPEQALMVGDTEYDAEMAAALGMPMVGVACGVHDAARIRKAGALAVLPSVAVLPDWLAQQG
jgi:phosphoglycolate phosphatase